MPISKYNLSISLTSKPCGREIRDKSFDIDTGIKQPRKNVNPVDTPITQKQGQKDFSKLPDLLEKGYGLLSKSFTKIIQGILDKYKGKTFKVKLTPDVAADMLKLFGEIKEELSFDDYLYLIHTAQGISKSISTKGLNNGFSN